MKLGNISQTRITVPQFFLYQNIRNIETFKITLKPKPFNENILLKSMKEMNYNNNYRNINRLIFDLDTPINNPKPTIKLKLKPQMSSNMLQSKMSINYAGRNYKRTACLDNHRGSATALHKMTYERFNKTDQHHLSQTHISQQTTELKPFRSYSKVRLNDALSVKNKHPWISHKKTEKKDQFGSKHQNDFSQEEMFQQTLMSKVLSMKMISNKIKEAITDRHFALTKNNDRNIENHLNDNKDNFSIDIMNKFYMKGN